MSPEIRPVIITPEIYHRFQSFILFEPSSSRMSEVDILIRGVEVRDMHDAVIHALSEDDSLKTQILRNKLSKIGQMLELLTVYDNVVISKFFDRIWRRYSYVSNIGEHFLDLPTFLHFFPQYRENIELLMAQRLDDEDEEDMDGGSSDVETDVVAVVPPVQDEE